MSASRTVAVVPWASACERDASVWLFALARPTFGMRTVAEAVTRQASSGQPIVAATFLPSR